MLLLGGSKRLWSLKRGLCFDSFPSGLLQSERQVDRFIRRAQESDWRVLRVRENELWGVVDQECRPMLYKIWSAFQKDLRGIEISFPILYFINASCFVSFWERFGATPNIEFILFDSIPDCYFLSYRELAHRGPCRRTPHLRANFLVHRQSNPDRNDWSCSSDALKLEGATHYSMLLNLRNLIISHMIAESRGAVNRWRIRNFRPYRDLCSTTEDMLDVRFSPYSSLNRYLYYPFVNRNVCHVIEAYRDTLEEIDLLDCIVSARTLERLALCPRLREFAVDVTFSHSAVGPALLRTIAQNCPSLRRFRFVRYACELVPIAEDEDEDDPDAAAEQGASADDVLRKWNVFKVSSSPPADSQSPPALLHADDLVAFYRRYRATLDAVHVDLAFVQGLRGPYPPAEIVARIVEAAGLASKPPRRMADLTFGVINKAGLDGIAVRRVHTVTLCDGAADIDDLTLRDFLRRNTVTDELCIKRFASLTPASVDFICFHCPRIKRLKIGQCGIHFNSRRTVERLLQCLRLLEWVELDYSDHTPEAEEGDDRDEAGGDARDRLVQRLEHLRAKNLINRFNHNSECFTIAVNQSCQEKQWE